MTMHQLWIYFILHLSPVTVYKETCLKPRSPETKLGEGMFCFQKY